MSTKEPAPPPIPRLRIEGDMTVFRAAELKPQVLAEVPPQAIELDGVTEIDTAGVQLLLLACREARAGCRELRLLAPSNAVAAAIDLLHLRPTFGEAWVDAAAGSPQGRQEEATHEP